MCEQFSFENPPHLLIDFLFLCAGSRHGISAKVTFLTSVTVNTTLWWKRPRFTTTPALTYPRWAPVAELRIHETFWHSCQLSPKLYVSGWEPACDLGAEQPADDDSGGAVQPAQGEPWWLPRHLQPRVERCLRFTFSNLETPSCRTHQQVGSSVSSYLWLVYSASFQHRTRNQRPLLALELVELTAT